MLLLCVTAFASHAQNCQGLDFETYTAGAITASTQLSGWVITNGVHMNTAGSNNCNPLSCCPNPPAQSALLDVTNGLVDTQVGSIYTIYSVFGSTPGHTNASTSNPQLDVAFGGNKIFRLNHGGSTIVERIQRTLTVTPSTSMLYVAFIAVLHRGHDCCNGTAVYASVNTATCPIFYASGASVNPCTGANEGIVFYDQGTGAPYTPTSTAFGIFNKWQIRSVDLSAYIGQTVAVNVMASHCSSGGHVGYTYLDMACGAAIIQNNNVTAQTATLCSTGPATITAPAYFSNYSWTGPSAFTATTSVIEASVSGIYTLTTYNGFMCGSTTRTLNVHIGPPTHSISTSHSVSCANKQVVLQAKGMTSQTWNTGSQSSSITVTPSTTTTYSFNGLDANGCSVTALFTQSVNPCASITELNGETTVSIFPNPGHGRFTVILQQERVGILTLDNLAGQEVYKGEVRPGTNEINLSTLAQGVYVWTVTYEKGSRDSGRLTVLPDK